MGHAMEKAAKRRHGHHHSKKSAKAHSHSEAAEIIPANYAEGDLKDAEEADFEHIAEDLETFELKKKPLEENQKCLSKSKIDALKQWFWHDSNLEFCS